jgi:hypothetical protein
MKPLSPRPLILVSFVIAALSLRSDLTAQQPSAGGNAALNHSSSARLSQLSAFEQYVAYWTTEPGWRTELQLRNNLESAELTVTPALRTADGAETALSPVSIKPSDVVSLDLSSLLSASPKLDPAYGSLVLRYRANVHRALYAAVMIRADGQPIAFHLDAEFHAASATRASREGIWWLPGESVTDFLILTNTGDRQLDSALTLYDSAGKGWHQALSLGPRQTQRLSVRSLLQKSGLSGFYGGIRLESVRTAGYPESLHLLFDEQGGFAANMKMFTHDPDVPLSSHLFGAVKEWTTRAPMLALSSPDPALGFPKGTTLQPKVFVRNTSAKPYTAHIRFKWHSATTTGTTSPANLILKPNATQVADVATLQAQNLIPADAQWAAVVLSAPVQPDDLMAVAASYDQTGRYGTQTPFTDQLASHWEGGEWEVDSMHNSLVAIGNAGNKPARAELTLLYNQGSEQYHIEQSLAPDEQTMIDFGKLIRGQVPDKDGRVMPPDLKSGAYRLRDLADPAAGSLYEGKVTVDKTNGHAAYGCMICCGPEEPSMEYDPITLIIQAYENQVIQASNSCGGGIQNVTAYFPTWWTDNTSIATASRNKITGVGTGSTNHHAQSEPRYWGFREYASSCPTSQPQADGGTNVCDFTIAPANVVAQNCNGSSQNSNNFNTTITPAGNSCLADQAKSTCSESSTGNIDFAVGSPKCVYNLGNPSATVTYFAGPPLPNGNAGTIGMKFNLVFNGSSVSQTDNATVECPK